MSVARAMRKEKNIYIYTHTYTHTHIYKKQNIIQPSEKEKRESLLFLTTWMDMEDSMPSEISRHRRTALLEPSILRNLKQSSPQNQKVEQW